MTQDDSSTARESIKIYVPAYQKEVWSEHATRLDMSLSEFARTMIQAGRRGFSPEPLEPRLEPDHPRGNDLKSGIVDILRVGPRDWDGLLAELTDGFEERLEETLAELRDEDRIDQSPRTNVFTLVEDSDEQ